MAGTLHLRQGYAKDKAMERLRKLWALRKIRFISGPYDPRIEVGDEMYVTVFVVLLLVVTSSAVSS